MKNDESNLIKTGGCSGIRWQLKIKPSKQF
jgi:hypothetical protein